MLRTMVVTRPSGFVRALQILSCAFDRLNQRQISRKTHGNRRRVDASGAVRVTRMDARKFQDRQIALRFQDIEENIAFAVAAFNKNGVRAKVQ